MEVPQIGFVIFDGFQPLDLIGPASRHRHLGVAPSDYRDRFRSTRECA